MIALSGGVDSSVLLHLMHEASMENQEIKLEAVHIDHGISTKSHEWSEFCRTKCEILDIPYQSFKIDDPRSNGESPEASARKYRYALLGNLLKHECVLLTAHHQNDQCETMLLQLLRGGGLSGISSMPEIQEFGRGYLARPLLNIDQEEIKCYAIDKGIEWIEDESNIDTNIDRNYIRHNVFPLIKQRWPSASKTISRTARHAAENLTLSQALAKQDYIKAKIVGVKILSVSSVQQFSYARQRNLLRYWIREHDKPVPSTVIMGRILTESIESEVDRNPLVRWDKTEVRRYRDRLYILDPLPEVDKNTFFTLEQASESLPLGKISYDYTIGNGINAELLKNRTVSIGFRDGGETIFPYNSPYKRRVKKVMSECGVPPWLRDLMPLVFIDNELAAIPGIGVDKKWTALSGQSSISLHWHIPSELEQQCLPFTKSSD